jgi:RNA polymerase sigma-70 factor (ECF subfamily)
MLSDEDMTPIGALWEERAIGAAAGNPEAAAEAALVHGAQAGDRACFERLYRIHSGRVYALCLRLTRRAEEAEELTQEVFVRAWQNLSHFGAEGHFKAWLTRVAVNLVAGERRTRGRRGIHEEWNEETPELRPAAAPELSVDLEHAIGLLPEKARTVFVLHDVQGYRHEDIARITGAAVGTTKAQLHRARRRLREVLKS